MATVEPKFSGVSLATPAGQMFTVDINQAAFTDAETTAGGRLSPCGATDFATKPTTLAQSLLVSRGQLRFKLMMNQLFLIIKSTINFLLNFQKKLKMYLNLAKSYGNITILNPL